MEKICWENSNYEDSQLVILGIPDESQSHSLRVGTSEAPDKIREISNLRDTYTRNGKKSVGLPVGGILKKVFDYGNITRQQIPETLHEIINDSKVPIVIGGDHSLTSQILKQFKKKFNDISLVYLDAHPDFVTSTRNYYGSVFGDVLKEIDPITSFQIGTRTPEKEESDNLIKNQISVITPFDIAEKGIIQICNQILEKTGNFIYVSFDMDCIDPAHAPGVSVPVPIGISSTDVTFILKKIAQKGIIGMDIVEVCPPYDINDRTSHLASRIIGEIISSTK
jgi:agmatinase